MPKKINERKIIDAIIERLEVSNGDAQGIYEAAQMSQPELFNGSKSQQEIIEELCK